jgi:hypothetical protein
VGRAPRSQRRPHPPRRPGDSSGPCGAGRSEHLRGMRGHAGACGGRGRELPGACADRAVRSFPGRAVSGRPARSPGSVGRFRARGSPSGGACGGAGGGRRPARGGTAAGRATPRRCPRGSCRRPRSATWRPTDRRRAERSAAEAPGADAADAGRRRPPVTSGAGRRGPSLARRWEGSRALDVTSCRVPADPGRGPRSVRSDVNETQRARMPPCLLEKGTP